MNLKKVKIIAVFSIFVLCFISHFAYEFMPSIITSIMFPVNESIFEHMKIIYTSIIIWSIIEYFILKKLNIKTNNNIFNAFISGIINIIIFLIMYLPIYYSVAEYLPRTLTILFISICLTQYISYSILTTYKINDKYYVIGIILIYMIFAYFTYHPIKVNFFYDTANQYYGIKKD